MRWVSLIRRNYLIPLRFLYRLPSPFPIPFSIPSPEPPLPVPAPTPTPTPDTITDTCSVSHSQVAYNSCRSNNNYNYNPFTLSSVALADQAKTAKTLSIPVNYRQTVGSGAGGVLHFEYAWDSSTGKLTDLSACLVGEEVTYSGGNPFVWPKPPWNGSTPNPTIIMPSPGSDGIMQDNHSSKPFVKPYKEDGFAATIFTEFVITRPNGSIVRIPRLSKEDVSRIGKIVLGNRETYGQRLLLNQWYDFTTTGEYKIMGGLPNPVNESGGAVEIKLSGTFSLQIQPRNPVRLNQVCQALLKIAIESSDVSEAIEAWIVLSYVQDPIAVPYLEKGLKKGSWYGCMQFPAWQE